MKVRFRLAVLLLSAVATVGVASPAMAKGGGGGGGGGVATCASINSWTAGVQTVNGQPAVILRVGVFNGCVDEGVGAGKSPSVDMSNYDTATGQWLGASVNFANYGQNYFTYNFGDPNAAPSTAWTNKLTVWRANGQLQDSRSTTQAEVLAMVQPAA